MTPGSLVGLFYLNDTFASWISITTDLGASLEICLFDHYSFMPRLHYLSLPETNFSSSIVVKVIDKPIDYNCAVNTYHASKTFDSTANWALRKYYEPLLDAVKHPEKACFKPVLLLGSRNL